MKHYKLLVYFAFGLLVAAVLIAWDIVSDAPRPTPYSTPPW